MPTPSTDSGDDPSRPSHNTCPPDDDRAQNWRARTANEEITNQSDSTQVTSVDDTMPSSRQGESGQTAIEPSTTQQPHDKNMDLESDGTSSEMNSPASADSPKQDTGIQQTSHTDSYIGRSPSSSHDFSNVRLLTSSPSSFLRAGSRFKGTQQSERQVYDVQVDIKHVDMRESFLCGYLRIQGLTEDHPTLTTYFEGEIIGSKYSFLTKHEDWGSTDKVDLQHWAKFQAFRPYARAAKKGPFHIQNLGQRDNIFMRWKEHFLVPDHRVRTISGASFEGFYYICFNQLEGTVSGIYFHAKSEKFQQLELKHVEDRGCFKAMEFR